MCYVDIKNMSWVREMRYPNVVLLPNVIIQVVQKIGGDFVVADLHKLHPEGRDGEIPSVQLFGNLYDHGFQVIG